MVAQNAMIPGARSPAAAATCPHHSNRTPSPSRECMRLNKSYPRPARAPALLTRHHRITPPALPPPPIPSRVHHLPCTVDLIRLCGVVPRRELDGALGQATLLLGLFVALMVEGKLLERGRLYRGAILWRRQEVDSKQQSAEAARHSKVMAALPDFPNPPQEMCAGGHKLFQGVVREMTAGAATPNARKSWTRITPSQM